MAEYLSPGVYVEEFESGSRPMTGVSTSTVGFLGVAQKGPDIGPPVLITSYADYTRKFGSYLPEKIFGDFRFMPYAVEQFFQNGGSRCFVMRVCPDGAKEASYNNQFLNINAKSKGSWGNDISLSFSVIKNSFMVAKAKEYLTVENASPFEKNDIVALIADEGTEPKYVTIKNIGNNNLYFDEKELDNVKEIETYKLKLEIIFDSISEVYENITFNEDLISAISKKLAKSELISINSIDYTKIKDQIIKDKHILKWLSSADGNEYTFMLKDGNDWLEDNPKPNDTENKWVKAFKGSDSISDQKTGLAAFTDNDVVSLMCVPGVTDTNIQQEVITHCELLGNRFAILDMPRNEKNVEKLKEHRNNIDSSYAAMYHPWIQAYDSLNKNPAMFPPSGAVAGVYSRSDQERGVHKAPANEIVRGISGLDCVYNDQEQSLLNPIGINLIRSFTGMGIRVWGARTCSSNSLWKYVNIRRLFIYLEESIKTSTSWIVFEPNDELLWIRVKRTIEVFLNNEWRKGALFGSSPEEAFFIDIGRTTMTQNDIDNGRLICVIGVAPIKPAEFVIFRLTQKTMSE